jgi:2,4-dienoyl-CoA reductase-like NADH-dependent reductase (Old Yellow Enzyme family)
MSAYQHLFAPLTIRGRTIPNRIVSTPHATGWELPGGLISDQYEHRKPQFTAGNS